MWWGAGSGSGCPDPQNSCVGGVSCSVAAGLLPATAQVGRVAGVVAGVLPVAGCDRPGSGLGQVVGSARATPVAVTLSERVEEVGAGQAAPVRGDPVHGPLDLDGPQAVWADGGGDLLAGPAVVVAGVGGGEAFGQGFAPQPGLGGGPDLEQVVQDRGVIGGGFGVDPGGVAGEPVRGEAGGAGAGGDLLGGRGRRRRRRGRSPGRHLPRPARRRRGRSG